MPGFQVNTMLEIEGSFYTIIEVNPKEPTLLKILNLSDNNAKPVEFDIAEAIQHDVQYRVVQSCERDVVMDFITLPEKVKKEAEEKYQKVINVRQFKKELFDKRLKDVKGKLAHYCKGLGFSLATYYNYEKRLAEKNDAKQALVRKARTDKGVATRLNKEVVEIMDKIANKHLDDELIEKISYSYQILESTIKRRNLDEEKQLEVPSHKTFWLYLHELKLKRARTREGKLSQNEQNLWDKWYNNIFSKAGWPLEWVLIDHHVFDLQIVDPISRERIGRPWVTLLFDAYTRYAIGYYISMDRPSANSAQLALAHAIFPKSRSWLEKMGCKNGYDGYGTPFNLTLDNAWEFSAKSLVSLTKELKAYGTHSIEPTWRPPYKARRGALIERFFGTLETGLVHKMPGTTKSNPFLRGEYNSEANACFLIEDVERLVTRFIVDYYHQVPRQELDGLTPAEKWTYGVQKKFNGQPSFPTSSYVEKTFRVLETKARKVSEHGISFKGLHFGAPQLNNYYKPRNEPGSRPELYLRYDPKDLSAVSVFYEGRYICDAECKQFRTDSGGIRHYSLSMLDRIKEIMKQRRIKALTSSVIHEIADEIMALSEQRKSEQGNIAASVDKGQNSKKTTKKEAIKLDKFLAKKNARNIKGELSNDEENYFSGGA